MPAKDLKTLTLTQNARKRAGLAQTLSLIGIFGQNFQHLVQGMGGKDRLPLAQGVLAGFRESRLAQRALQSVPDQIHQFGLLPDLFRNEPVQLQAASIDEIMPHGEKVGE